MAAKNKQKGFTILIAVITAGILLIISMSIAGIALKEQMLSTSNKDSQTAFYAADTGMECALYNDLKLGAFALDNLGHHPTSVNVSCIGNNISVSDNSGSIDSDYSYTFTVKDIPVRGSAVVKTCAVVIVTKNFNALSNIVTRIDSAGYNTCDSALGRLERGVWAVY